MVNQVKPVEAMYLTPVTSEVGHGDPFPTKSCHMRCTFCMIYDFLCRLEPKLLKQKCSPSDVFNPGDLKTRSW